ncbi:hypothetical protein BDZ97DRAFT_1912188 [Flammula alnicola]|nr:hypothetical protein BDZ97DRAFT_1912188 [Flammula alnicola]
MRLASSFIIHAPPANAPREVPTPLVFISARSWDDDSTSGMTTLASMLAEKGFTCIESDLAISQSSMSDSKLMMNGYESELASTIRLSAIPFPPVIVARASACLIAETYISSNPSSGLILISPPVSNAELSIDKLPTPLEEFNYEPNFPIAVIATPHEVERLRESNRICQSDSVDVIRVVDINLQQTLIEIEQWLDRLGI